MRIQKYNLFWTDLWGEGGGGKPVQAPEILQKLWRLFTIVVELVVGANKFYISIFTTIYTVLSAIFLSAL